MEPLASQTAIEESRLEMLRKAARILLDWNRPIEEIVEITGLPKNEIEGLRDSGANTDTMS